MKSTWIIVISCIIISKTSCDQGNRLSFPDELKFGVATSALQIEGAWNVSGKGESIWDWWTHNYPSRIADHNNVDVTCNSYYKYKEDVQWIKNLGFDYYRFSISWPRIFPNGFSNNKSKEGMQYYKNLTNELLANGIEPIVTLYHFDHPQVLENMGGWMNELMVEYFADYARYIFEELGPLVKIFVTINEPMQLCRGYAGPNMMSPGKDLFDVGLYMCLHNILKAHATAYHIYDKEFRQSQDGQIGHAAACSGYILDDSNDTSAADTAFQFDCGILAHPIYFGDYSPIVKERIAMISKEQGYTKSRLPKLSPEWITYIKGTADYFGINHYTSRIFLRDPDEEVGKHNSDSGIIDVIDNSWLNSSAPWLKIVPEGFRNLLRKIKDDYNNPLVYILENGMADNGELEDYNRMNAAHSYLTEMIKAIKEDGCRILRYTIWSLLDNFELNSGFTQPFGIIKVDFNDVDRKRTAKSSAIWWKANLRTRKLQDIPRNRS